MKEEDEKEEPSRPCAGRNGTLTPQPPQLFFDSLYTDSLTVASNETINDMAATIFCATGQRKPLRHR